MRLQRLFVEPGFRYEIHLLLDDRGLSPVGEIMASAQMSERRAFQNRVKRLARHGPEYSSQCDMVDAKNGIWKLHASKHIRVYCFRDAARFILCHAERKTRRRDDPQSLPRAVALRNRYFAEKR